MGDDLSCLTLDDGRADFGSHVTRLETTSPTQTSMTSLPLLADAGRSAAGTLPAAPAGLPESGVYPHLHSPSLRSVGTRSEGGDFHLVPLQMAVESVAAGVAHHINELLTPLARHTRLLAEHLTRDEPATASVWSVLESGTRLTSLADGLLTFSALNAVSPTPLNVATVIQGYREMISHAAGTGVDVEMRFGPSVGLVRVDAMQFERSLFSLVEKARESMGGRGHLHLEVRNAHPDDRLLLPEPMRGTPFVVLEVSDNGCGLSDDDRDRLFEPFFGSKTGGLNVGLGLALVYGTVRRMGGRIAVSSAIGRGTTVRLYLPRIDGPTEARPGHAGGATVLLVDDDASVREYARRVLVLGGYQILEAADGEEALQLAARHTGPIDLLVSDVLMPRVGGRELAERLTATRPEVCVLLTSGCPDDDNFNDHIIATATEFLPKPFTPDALLKLAHHTLSRSRVAE